MNANELVTKAIREGMEYVGGKEVLDYDKEHFDNVDRMASTLSAGLIVLTEERLKKILIETHLDGTSLSEEPDQNCRDMANGYASRIMREVKGGE